MSAYATQSAQPRWLTSLLAHQSPPPRLYAWSPLNINYGFEYSPVLNNEDLDRRIFVLGVGNLGRLYATCLSNHPSRPPITLVVHRQELLSQWISSPGIEITRSGKLYSNKDFQIEWWTEQPPSQGEVKEVASGYKLQNLIIGTKAAAAMSQFDRLRRYLDQKTTIAFLQNGMSKFWPPHGEEYISQRYPGGNAPNILACVSNHGVYSEGPFKSVHASTADATVGPVLLNSNSSPAPSVSYLTETIATAPLLNANAVSKREIWVSQLQKLVVNSTINPLTAVLRCKNGGLFEDPNGTTAQVMDLLLTESSAVLQALINHPSSDEILTSSSSGSADALLSLKQLKEQLTERFSQPKLRMMLYRIGDIVKENNSSMLQDVCAGKPTEIHDFNSWLVETASFLQGRQPRGEQASPTLNVSSHRKLIALVESSSSMSESDLGHYFLS